MAGAADFVAPRPLAVTVGNYLLMYADGRFARSPRFRYFALNTEMRWRALQVYTEEAPVATYSCDSGFVINGEATRTCGEDGVWSGEAPTCEVNPCIGERTAFCNAYGEACMYRANWTVHGGSISFEVRAATTGWVGIGFSNDQLMPMSDVVVGAANSEGSLIHDRFTNTRAMPPIDVVDHLTQTAVFVSDGDTVIKFTRPRDSERTDDISLDQCRFLLFAFSGTFNIGANAIGYHGSYRVASSALVCFPTC